MRIWCPDLFASFLYKLQLFTILNNVVVTFNVAVDWADIWWVRAADLKIPSEAVQ